MKAVQIDACGGPENLLVRDVATPESGPIEGSMRSLARRGMLVNFGAASGAVESIEPLALAEAGSLFFTRPHMADYMRDAEEVAWRGREMFERHAAGRVAATIDRILPLDAAAEVHRILEARETRGKLLLEIG